MAVVLHVEDFSSEFKVVLAAMPGDVVIDLIIVVADLDGTAAASVIKGAASTHDRVWREDELRQRLLDAVHIEA